MTNTLNKTVLIIDDTPNNLQLIVKYLRDANYKILIAQNGIKAIETAIAYHPDLILLDVMMSGIDGFTTCDRLKQNSKTKDIPIIFMTALTKTINKVRGFELGAVDYITKPINKEELLARIKTHLSLQNLYQNSVRDTQRQKLIFKISDRIRQCQDLESIVTIATKEIRKFLECEKVWLTKNNNNNNISLEAYASVDSKEPEQHILKKYLTGDREECSWFQEGNIRVIDLNSEQILSFEELVKSRDYNCPIVKNYSFLNCSLRIILPISINSDDIINNNRNNALWGWLIVDYQNCTQWQIEEINHLKILVNQLAIAIKQGLLYRELYQQALIDSLTQIYNRRYFDLQLEKEWRRLQRTSSPLSLIMCDVDCFKLYNDTYGHQQGDKCLQQIAKIISKTIKRSADIIARYGGEEFVIILPNTPKSGAIRVAEAIRFAVKQLNIPHSSSTIDSTVTLSVGVANTIPNSQDNPKLLIKAADVALYQAKERGRNCVNVYPHIISNSKTQQEEAFWLQRLRYALQNNLFGLYAQPIASLNSKDRRKHFEILLRLTDEEDRVITPNLFLNIAERYSLMPDIDTWVINNLLEQLADRDFSYWQNYQFSINLSGASLNSEPFLEFLSQTISNLHLPPNLFCFEITETVAVSDLKRVSTFINTLKHFGCNFALDDFGKGMSSLTYLHNLSVDYLKIDGSFITNINNNQTAKVIVKTINNIASEMGLKTIAEFVEDRVILDTIRNLKIDYAQGYHLGHPKELINVISNK